MIIRLGYVAITKTLENITSSSSYTYTNYLKDENHDELLDKTIISNLEDLNRIIDYNIKNNIHFYRLTSKLIPLGSHNLVDYDYINKYKDLYQKIGLKIKNNNIRVDVHPDQFTVLNSTKKEVIENTFNILKYHYNILESLNIENKIIILHIGSSVFGKKNSINRFINSFRKLPDNIQKSIAIENDDKIYNVSDCLELSNKLNIPFVLDYHHFKCNPSEINYEDIFKTWKKMNPKIHFSSPKNNTKKDMRSHHDYINVFDFIEFIESIKHLNYDIDIMLEAKAKDEALFRLVRQLKYYTDYKFIDETSFYL